VIELTALQFSIICGMVTVIVWLIRLEGRVNTEKALREQSENNTISREQFNSGRVTNLEGRILDEMRKLREDITRFQDRLDTKQDKAHLLKKICGLKSRRAQR
jgi:hypothetical protein